MDIFRKVEKAMRNYPLYSQEDTALEKKVVPVKLFALWSWTTWYLTEFDATSGDAFGYVEWLSQCDEWGYFNINELKSLVRFGIPMVEVDKYFEPKLFGDIKRGQ